MDHGHHEEKGDTGVEEHELREAAGILYGYGIMLSPAMGALLMSASTVIVAINARMLRLPGQ